jgi:hypothetical protein
MRWMPVIMGIGIITAGCGSESTGSGGSSSGGDTATTGASSSGGGGQGGSGGSGGATSSTGGTTSSSTTGGSSSATSSTGTGMGAVFGATCTVDADCASGLCANFMQKGQLCSVKCTTAAECPPESPGCGGQGVCKPPL